MAEGARINNIEALKTFRAALIKFAEVGNVALTGADSDITRVLGWLERDQTLYWNTQLKKRHEAVIAAEEKIREKRITKNFDGTQKSVVDEQKVLNTCKRLEAEAAQKCQTVKKAIGVLRKEEQMYKGRTQKLATTLQADIPRAVYQIDNMLSQLEVYLSLQTQGKGINLAAAAASIAASAPKRVGVEALRDRTPVKEDRQHAPVRMLAADDPIFQPWQVGAISDWQKESLDQLPIERKPVDPDLRVVIAKNVFTLPKIYMERVEAFSDADSGWYIGPAGEPAPTDKPELESIRFGDLFKARPDIAELMSMPTGFLIAIDAGGPTAILDALGLDVWAIALINSEQPEEKKEDEKKDEATA